MYKADGGSPVRAPCRRISSEGVFLKLDTAESDKKAKAGQALLPSHCLWPHAVCLIAKFRVMHFEAVRKVSSQAKLTMLCRLLAPLHGTWLPGAPLMESDTSTRTGQHVNVI